MLLIQLIQLMKILIIKNNNQLKILEGLAKNLNNQDSNNRQNNYRFWINWPLKIKFTSNL